MSIKQKNAIGLWKCMGNKFYIFVFVAGPSFFFIQGVIQQ